MLTLYHAAGAVCAAKVRIVLSEKALSYDSRLLDLQRGDQFDAEYLKLNPQAVVPTLVDDGQVLHESTIINEYLDDAYPQVALRPSDPIGRARSRLWTRREDTIHAAVNTFSSIALFRPNMLAKPEAEREAGFRKIPSPARQAKFRELVALGAASPIALEDAIAFVQHLRRMDAALAAAPWLGGEQFGLADAGLVSFLHRFQLLGCAWIWHEPFAHVRRWFDACRGRRSVTDAIDAFTSAPAVSHMLAAGDACAADIRAVFDEAHRIA